MRLRYYVRCTVGLYGSWVGRQPRPYTLRKIPKLHRAGVSKCEIARSAKRCSTDWSQAAIRYQGRYTSLGARSGSLCSSHPG